MGKILSTASTCQGAPRSAGQNLRHVRYTWDEATPLPSWLCRPVSSFWVWTSTHAVESQMFLLQTLQICWTREDLWKQPSILVTIVLFQLKHGKLDDFLSFRARNIAITMSLMLVALLFPLNVFLRLPRAWKPIPSCLLRIWCPRHCRCGNVGWPKEKISGARLGLIRDLHLFCHTIFFNSHFNILRWHSPSPYMIERWNAPSISLVWHCTWLHPGRTLQHQGDAGQIRHGPFMKNVHWTTQVPFFKLPSRTS